MNERVRTSMKNIMYLAAEAKRPVIRQTLFLASFANGIKNDKTSSEIHIIVCLLKTE